VGREGERKTLRDTNLFKSEIEAVSFKGKLENNC